MAKNLVVLCLGFLFLNELNAQSRTISGSVTDLQNKTPLTGATINLRNLSDSAMRNAVSDSSGRFVFSELASGSYLMTFSFVGYNPVTKNLVLDSTDITIDIAAVPSNSTQMENIVIKTI